MALLEASHHKCPYDIVHLGNHTHFPRRRYMAQHLDLDFFNTWIGIRRKSRHNDP